MRVRTESCRLGDRAACRCYCGCLRCSACFGRMLVFQNVFRVSPATTSCWRFRFCYHNSAGRTAPDGRSPAFFWRPSVSCWSRGCRPSFRVLRALPGGGGPGVVAKDYLTQSGIFQLCGFALAYVAADDWRRGRRWRAFILAGLALLFFANIIYLASGRTELVLMPIFILLLGFRLSGWRGLIAGLVVCTVLAGIAWTSSAYMRGQLTSLITIWHTPDYMRAPLTNLIKGSKLDPGDVALASAGLRLEYYRKSIAVIMNAPIMGHGTGTIRARFEDVAAGETGVAGITTGNPHQQTFAVAIQLGLVGAALLCAMWITHLLLFRGAGVVPWLGLLVVVQNILGSSLNSNLFDFTQGWIYVFGVGVLGGAVLRGIPDQMNTATSARNDL